MIYRAQGIWGGNEIVRPAFGQLSGKRNDMRTVMMRSFTYLIKHFHWEPLATLGALKRLLSVVETLIVLLQVTYAVEYFIAFVAPKLPRIILAVAAITALVRVSNNSEFAESGKTKT